MHRLIFFMISLTFVIPFSVHAAPQFNSYFGGSYFFIEVTNNEDRAYSCSYSYTFSYSDFGEYKTRTHTGNFTVAAKWSGVALKSTGSWVNPQLQGSANINCS